MGKSITRRQHAHLLDAFGRLNRVGLAAKVAGLHRETASKYLHTPLDDPGIVYAAEFGGTVSAAPAAAPAPPQAPPDALPPLVAELMRERTQNASAAAVVAERPHVVTPPVATAPDLLYKIPAALRKTPLTLEEIAERGRVSRETAEKWIAEQQRCGVNLHCFGDRYSIEKAPPLAHLSGDLPEYVSRPDHTFYFGASGDQHLCSKYERLDVLNRLYDRYADEGVDRVFNTGNWIDGESKVNKFDLKVHGMDAQLAYLAEHFPQRPGITTYAVAGDDHEGWYAQREGVDIGRKALHAMTDADRTDWVDLGYMEAHIRLVNASSGQSAILSVVHPGGGSAYALSYSIQKIVESYDGGEKPAVGLYGHYHKLWSGNIRNVFTVQTGCCLDQTPFMRKKRLEAHVGGFLVKIRQDPRTGAITEMTATMLRYFNRGYYNDRWSHAHEVTLPVRD